MNKSFIKYITCFVVLSSLILTGCNKDDENLQQSRLFQPIGFSAIVTPEMTALSWKPFKTDFQGPTKSYEVIISDTEDFSNIVYENIVTEPYVVITEGPVQTNREVYDFYLKVKAISAATGTGDSKYTDAFMFSPYRENIFSTVRNEDLANTFAILRWTKMAENSEVRQATSIRVVFPNGSTHNYDISLEEDQAGQKQIDGLTPLTDYMAYIYNGSERRGRTYFTTRSPYEVIVDPTTFIETMKTVESNWIVRLKPGNYNFPGSSVSINKSVSLEAYSSDASKAPLVCISKFALRERIGKFSLSGIKFTGQIDEAEAVKTDFIELSKADGEIGDFSYIDSLMISNCEIYNFGKSFILYSSSAGDLGLISIDNCIIHDINTTGSQGAQAIDLRNNTAQDIRISNSTLYKHGRTLLRMKAAVAGQKFSLTNCTVYDINTQGQLYIDFSNAASTTGTYIIKNNILAKAKGKGYRIGNETSDIFTSHTYNNETEIDWTANKTPNTAGWNEDSPNFDEAPNFEKPNEGNFTLPKNSPLRTKASNGGPLGDPRWAK